VVIPLTDYLSKVFSFRRYIIGNTILFALFSMACAFTRDLARAPSRKPPARAVEISKVGFHCSYFCAKCAYFHA
jgi:hypothetical protein